MITIRLSGDMVLVKPQDRRKKLEIGTPTRLTQNCYYQIGNGLFVKSISFRSLVTRWGDCYHGRQSGLELFKTARQTCLHPTSPAFFAWQKFSQVIKTGICEPIGMHTRKRHLQTVFVHARLRRQLSCLRRLSFDLSWVLPGSPVSRASVPQ